MPSHPQAPATPVAALPCKAPATAALDAPPDAPSGCRYFGGMRRFCPG
jgi:hypothetical protein